MIKETLKFGKGDHIVVYRPQVKMYLPPIITGEKEVDGVVHYKLANGNTMPKDKYDSLWNPPKGKILPKRYKGANPDKTKVI